jgi:SAM-dependent methyltransferase
MGTADTGSAADLPAAGREGKQAALVQAMFDRVAPRYDLANAALSLGQDAHWRRVTAIAARPADAQVLDVASGPGNVAVELRERGAAWVTALDLSYNMLAEGARRGLDGISWVNGDAMALPFPDASFDVVFGRDLDGKSFEDTIRDFMRTMNQGDIALFYYSGHAVQVAGHNYILPVDASLASPYDLEVQAYNFSNLLSYMGQSSALQIAILDACRDNPFRTGFYYVGDKKVEVAGNKGLAPAAPGLVGSAGRSPLNLRSRSPHPRG